MQMKSRPKQEDFFTKDIHEEEAPPESRMRIVRLPRLQ